MGGRMYYEDEELARYYQSQLDNTASDEALARALSAMEDQESKALLELESEMLALRLQQEIGEEGVETHIGDTYTLPNEYHEPSSSGTSNRSYSGRGSGSASRTSNRGLGRDSEWEEPRDDEGGINPDNMSYEELNELEESMGSVGKGLSRSVISRLPSHKFKSKASIWGKRNKEEPEECSICRMEYKNGNAIITLPCSHRYHKECISKWLEKDKKCCICKSEVSI